MAMTESDFQKEIEGAGLTPAEEALRRRLFDLARDERLLNGQNLEDLWREVIRKLALKSRKIKHAR